MVFVEIETLETFLLPWMSEFDIFAESISELIQNDYTVVVFFGLIYILLFFSVFQTYVCICCAVSSLFNICIFTVSANRSLKYLLEWHNLARIYLFSMTENMRSVIIRHKEALFTDEVKRKCNIEERRVLSAATLPELDEVYTRLVVKDSLDIICFAFYFY